MTVARTIVSNRARALDDAEDEIPQFAVDDHRTPDEIIAGLAKSGYIPSYCSVLQARPYR